MTAPGFEARTNILYGALKDLGASIPVRKPKKASFALARGGHTLQFDDDTQFTLGIYRAVSGMPKGEFRCEAGFSLSGGPVPTTLAQASAKTAEAVGDPWLVGSTWYLVPRLFAKAPNWDYRFVAGTDTEKLTKQVMSDIRKYLFPVIHAFVDDYSKAADVFLTGDVQQLNFSAEPFSIGLSVLKLASRLDEAEALAKRAAAMKEKFYDYSPKKSEKLIAAFRKTRS